MSNNRKLVVYKIQKNQDLDTIDFQELNISSGSESDSESWGEDEHLKALYEDPAEKQEKRRKEKIELLFARLEHEFEKDSDEYRQQVYQKAFIGVLVCNGLFIAANLFSPPEETSYQYEFCLSTLLPLSLYAFNKLFLKGTALEMIPGICSELIAAGLQKQGAPFWAGPVLTSAAAVAFTENKVSKWISTASNEISKTISSSVNNISNFWYRSPSNLNVIKTKENEVEERKAMKRK